MSIDLTQDRVSFELPLQESIRELRRGYQSVSEYLEQTLAECDLRGAELADCRQQLAEARRSLNECEKQRAERARAEVDLLNRLATLKKHCESHQAEIAQANDTAARARAECAQARQRLEIQGEQCQQLQEQVDRLETEREASRSELAQLRTHFSRLAETAAEAAALRGELAAAQADLARLREQPSSPPEECVSYEQLAEAQSQREHLEQELDLLRHRSAELSESLVQQKRLAVEEREQWSEELRQLRHALERQSDALAQRTNQGAAASRARETEQPHAEQLGTDPAERQEDSPRNKPRKSGAS